MVIQPIVLRMVAAARKMLAAREGTVAMTFALSIIPVFGVVGAAVDYGSAALARSKLDAAADAAALSAVDKTAMAKNNQDARATALDVFKADASTVTTVRITKTSAKLTASGHVRTAVLSYTATVPTAFLGLIGINRITIGGSATAVSAAPTYMDFYLLLDNSPSMGLGATTSDIATMVANTPDQCAFACHDLSAAPNDYYSLAKKLGVQMRIDVMREATQQLMDTATNTETTSGQFRMAIYTFGASAAARGLTPIQGITSNLSKAKLSAGAIDLMTVPYQNYADDTDTDFGDVLTDLGSSMPNPGDGSSSSSRLEYLFFVSDGVADRALGSPACAQTTTTGSDPNTGASYVRCQEPIDTSLCTALKNRGIKIAVLYTTYLPLPDNSWYTTWIAPFSDNIATPMQNCASPGLYFEVSPTQGIADAMNALFQKAVQQARLTR